MKVIFLDVDGVLNKLDSPAMLPLSKSKLRLLRHIVSETGARIVLSSSWRLFPHARFKLMRTLRYKGMRVWKSTPDFETEHPNSPYWRGHEIEAFLKDRPRITKYVILDDNNRFLKDQLEFFVETDSYVGLTQELADKAIGILNG